MSEVCAVDLVLARKIQTACLQRLASIGQRPVADALAVNESTVSRLKDQHIETFSKFIAALGLKVVPAEHKCYPSDYIAHLQYFARIGMAQERPPSLEWEGE